MGMASPTTSGPAIGEHWVPLLLVAGLAGAGVGWVISEQRGGGCRPIGTSWPFSATVRANSHDAYDQQWGGVPILARPAADWGTNPTQVLRRVPFGAAVVLACGPIATAWPSSPPIALYWGVQGGGFIHDWDLSTAPDR